MKVYVMYYYEPYERSYNVGVYETYEIADAERKLSKDNGNPDAYYFEIMEFELNKTV